jgi:hypothetical protein
MVIWCFGGRKKRISKRKRKMYFLYGAPGIS